MGGTLWVRNATVLFGAAWLALALRPAQAGEVVTVSLTDGRQVTGELDEQTDGQRICLRFGADHVVVRRLISWKAIDVVWHDSKVFSKEQTLAAARRPGNTIPASDHTAQANERIDASDSAMKQPDATLVSGEIIPSLPADFKSAQVTLPFGDRVYSVQIHAEPQTWDADVELDGLSLQVLPLDATGRVTKVRGTLEAELFVTRRRGFLVVPNRSGTSPERIGRWTMQLNTHQITPDGAFVHLPFQNVRPEFDTDWSNLGLLHIRLVVPGHGVFESSIDGVALRPVTPIRDTLERFGGDRFLPTEQTGVNLPIGR